jgi:GT2 family glycosyltransferase/glycosyltransferase involved in cell wall biosynthesis
MSRATAPTVSIVLVNFRGTDDTLTAIEHLESLDWPAAQRQIIVVENASGDDSAQRLRALGDRITLVESSENLGFAGGCNLGVRHSSGDIVAFLNNDARPDAQWVRAAVDRFAESSRIGAVASRVLDWEGQKVDFVDAGLTWYGMGYKPFTAERFVPSMPQRSDVLFGTGSAMFVRRDVFDALGGFDERYFMFFEDVDLGWRLNLAGWRFAYAPESVAFHKHHASMGSFGQFREQYLLERNALFTLYKNLGDEALAETLPAAMALAVRRAMARGAVDTTALDIRAPRDEQQQTTIAKDALTAPFAIDQFVEHLPSLRASREQIQSTRVVSDAGISQLFGNTDVPAFENDRYRDGYEAIVSAFGVLGRLSAPRVVIITGDPIGAKLAGPAIRAWNMAHALAANARVTLVSMSRVEPVTAPFDVVRIRAHDDRTFAKLEAEADVIIFQGHALEAFPSLRASEKILVIDVYDPMHLEQLEQGRELPREVWARQVAEATTSLNEQLARGDFFLCASERQRHFYLGQLAALGRLTPEVYENDDDLTGLISVAPFGIDPTPPQHRRDVLKGVRPGIGADDKVLLWAGGLYNWFDPQTLIRAVARLSESRPQVRLFFQGTAHPHPDVPLMGIVKESRDLAAELGVLDRAVFFNDAWVEYSDRANYLLEADAGVSTHHDHIETTFSFRTRILDYLWAGLPMVVTEGDHFAAVVEAEGLGVVVRDGDVDGLVDALERVLFDGAFATQARENIARVREQYLWPVVLEPLVRFVADPRPARDRGAAGQLVARGGAAPLRAPQRQRGPVNDLKLVGFYLRNGGPAVVWNKATGRLRRRFAR